MRQMLESLRQISFFQDFTTEQLKLLQSVFEAYQCPPGVTIIREGEPAEYLYIILRGKVKVQYKPYDGSLITLTHLKEGDVFGWSAVIGSSTYTSSIVSEEEIDAIRVRGDDLRQICLEEPETGREVLDRLAQMVSSRWWNAREQVNSMLNEGMKKPRQQKNDSPSRRVTSA